MVRHKNLTLPSLRHVGVAVHSFSELGSAHMNLTTCTLESIGDYYRELRGLPVALQWREHIYEFGTYYGTSDGMRFAHDFSSNRLLSVTDGSQDLLGLSKAANEPTGQAAAVSPRSAA